MISVVNEAVSFEAAPVAAAQEWMVTAGNVPASADIVLCGQTTLTPCVSIARRPLAAAPAGAAKRRNALLANERRNKLFARGLKSGTATVRGCARIEEPTDGVATRCVGRFLHPPQLSHSSPR